MGNKLTVYQRMTDSTIKLCEVLKEELGVKACTPFAVRAVDALKELNLKTEAEGKKAANTFLDNLQTLVQGGITTEDYDKIDFVKRGNEITISARVQALLRAARRKGYIIVDTIVNVPQGEDIYFEEQFHNRSIVYILKDDRKNTERELTPERLIKEYFKKFLCRLEIIEISSNRRIMTVTEMSNDEVLKAHNSSDNGIFLSEWQEVKDKNGNTVYKDAAKNYPKKIKVIFDGKNNKEIRYNESSIWHKWTGEMVRKTVLRRALKNVKEILPELGDTILAFDTDIEMKADDIVIENSSQLDVKGLSNVNVDINNLTESQKQDVKEVLEIYTENPQLAEQDAEMIKRLFEEGKSTEELVNEYYAEICNIAKSKNLYPLIENLIKAVKK